MPQMNVHAMLECLSETAQAAGATIMRHYAAGTVARKKADRSPVTIADEEAEALIISRLRQIAPDIPVVAEEQTAAGVTPDIGKRFFLVDPLDGTREFLDRNGEFTVNIALIDHGAPVAGVVFAPAMGRLFIGAEDQAFEIKDGLRRRIHARPAPTEGLVAVASRSHRDHKTDEILSAYAPAKIVAAGSSVKFCMIAASEADLYPRHGPTMEWDTAAGHAVLAASGGQVTHLDGRTPLTYGKVESRFVNPHFVAWGMRPLSPRA